MSLLSRVQRVNHRYHSVGFGDAVQLRLGSSDMLVVDVHDEDRFTCARRVGSKVLEEIYPGYMLLVTRKARTA